MKEEMMSRSYQYNQARLHIMHSSSANLNIVKQFSSLIKQNINALSDNIFGTIDIYKCNTITFDKLFSQTQKSNNYKKDNNIYIINASTTINNTTNVCILSNSRILIVSASIIMI